MFDHTPNPNYWGEFGDLVGAVLISLISGFISISQRIVGGHKASILWVSSEVMAAILAGYLAHETYPKLEGVIDTWISLPVFVSFAAYVGSRAFQILERVVFLKYGIVARGPKDPTDTP